MRSSHHAVPRPLSRFGLEDGEVPEAPAFQEHDWLDLAAKAVIVALGIVSVFLVVTL